MTTKLMTCRLYCITFHQIDQANRIIVHNSSATVARGKTKYIMDVNEWKKAAQYKDHIPITDSSGPKVAMNMESTNWHYQMMDTSLLSPKPCTMMPNGPYKRDKQNDMSLRLLFNMTRNHQKKCMITHLLHGPKSHQRHTLFFSCTTCFQILDYETILVDMDAQPYKNDTHHWL